MCARFAPEYVLYGTLSRALLELARRECLEALRARGQPTRNKGLYRRLVTLSCAWAIQWTKGPHGPSMHTGSRIVSV